MKQVPRVMTANTQLKSVRIAHEILAEIPKGVSFSDFVSEALRREIKRLKRRK